MNIWQATNRHSSQSVKFDGSGISTGWEGAFRACNNGLRVKDGDWVVVYRGSEFRGSFRASQSEFMSGLNTKTTADGRFGFFL